MMPTNSEFRRYGCQALCGSCLSLLLGFGVLNTFSVFQDHIGTEFENPSSTITWLFAFAAAFWQIAGFACGWISCNLGHRNAAFIGGTALVCGQIWSYFANDIYQYFLSIGILTSFGISSCYNVGLTVLGVHFKKEFELANSIASTFVGIASIVFPMLFDLEIEHFGYRGAYLILAGFCLHMYIAAILFRPTGHHRRKHITLKTTNIKDIVAVPGLLPYMFVYAFFYIPYITWITFAVPYALELGIDSLVAASLISVYGFGNIGGRCVQIVFTYFVKNKSMAQLLAGLCLAATSLVVFAFVQDFGLLVGSSFMFGFSLGFVLPSVTVIIWYLSIGNDFEVILGVNTTFIGLLNLCFGIVIGELRGLFGSYHLTFIIIALMLLMAILILVCTKPLRRMLPGFDLSYTEFPRQDEDND
ncbi:monocarboxylate transporter 13-like [Anneissia japonica]|uniref:monocarboxylate transporter 13-like n=1 Tax=Anneissia japonica TaxID=1529436 RepID=UPI001425717D|nr:monocarboxylate transporter 13-like [Anneissia japonica]XP_033107367.1 monocarboxylate transporter 13-like [Anneissia japonica]